MTRSMQGMLYSVAALLLGIAYLLLAASGVLRVSPVRLPTWVGYFVVGGLFLAPAFVFLRRKSHRGVKLLAFVVSLGCALIFPWFSDRFPAWVWLGIVLLLYLEVFWLLPWFKKRREYPDGRSRTGRTGRP